jgi:O-methyltransferase
MNALVKKFLRLFGVYTHRGPFITMDMRQMDNILYYSRMYERIQGVDGAIVECGVGKGRSFLFFNYLAYREGKKRTLWGFDSFEGFPEPTTYDESPRNPKKGEWSGFSPEDMQGILRTTGFTTDWIEKQVKLIKGFFSATLDQYDGAPIALLHIDSDLYESYKEPLEELFSKVVEGGLVLFDEYNRPNWPGATKAVDEFFAGTKYRVEHDGAYNKYFVIK